MLHAVWQTVYVPVLHAVSDCKDMYYILCNSVRPHVTCCVTV